MAHTTSPTSDLNWCFSTLGCADLSLEEITRLARNFSITQVELRAVSDRLDLPAVFAERFGEAGAMRTWLEEQQVAVASLDSSAKLIGCSAEAKQELLDFARWAHPLGIPAIRVFDGGTFTPRMERSDREEALDFLSWWQEEREAHGWNVDLIIETHDALCTAAHCLDLADRAEAPVHILWDSHHTWRKAGQDPLQSWAEMKHLVRHIHFKDSIDRPSARHPFTYTHLGEGQFPLEALLQNLRQDGFTGPVSLEWEKKWHPYLDPIDQALEKLDSWRLDRTTVR